MRLMNSALIVGAAAAGAVALAFSFRAPTEPPLDWGLAGTVYLDPAEGRPGDKVKFCLQAGAWRYLPLMARRIETPSCSSGSPPQVRIFPIDVEHAVIGKIPPKCSPGGKPGTFVIPDCPPGPFAVGMESLSRVHNFWGQPSEIRQSGPTVVGRVLPP